MRRRDDFEHFPTRRRQVSSELMIFGGDARALELREMEALVCAREIKFRFCIKVKRVLSGGTLENFQGHFCIFHLNELVY